MCLVPSPASPFSFPPRSTSALLRSLTNSLVRSAGRVVTQGRPYPTIDLRYQHIDLLRSAGRVVALGRPYPTIDLHYQHIDLLHSSSSAAAAPHPAAAPPVRPHLTSKIKIRVHDLHSQNRISKTELSPCSSIFRHQCIFTLLFNRRRNAEAEVTEICVPEDRLLTPPSTFLLSQLAASFIAAGAHFAFPAASWSRFSAPRLVLRRVCRRGSRLLTTGFDHWSNFPSAVCRRGYPPATPPAF